MARLQFDGIGSIEGHLLLPKGTYAFEIDSIDPNYKSKDKGSRAMRMKLHVIEGVDFEDGTSTVGMEKTMDLWFPTPAQSDGGASCGRRFVELAAACGIPGAVTFDKESKVLAVEDTDLFVSQRFVVTVAHRDYNGQPQEDFKNYKAYTA